MTGERRVRVHAYSHAHAQTQVQMCADHTQSFLCCGDAHGLVRVLGMKVANVSLKHWLHVSMRISL
jgi:hypothetical protein